jgi:predicted dehydrogenase
MINVGIIGAGFWGEKHADAINVLSNAKLVAANRTNPTALNEFIEKFGGKGYTDYRELLDDPQVDAVVIATPHHLHTQIVLDAANAGKHILLPQT